MNRFARAHHFLRAVGLKRAAQRVGYEVLRHAGHFVRRYPQASLEGFAPPPGHQLLDRARDGREYPAARPALQLREHYHAANPIATAKSILLANADRLVAGEVCDFAHSWRAFHGGDDWLQHPLSGRRAKGGHWSRANTLDRNFGDLKLLVEPSRFGFAHVLGRAFVASGNERYAETCWRLLEDWERSSEPQSGILWFCGQESAIRIIALAFAIHALAAAPATTPERAALCWRLIAAHADRIIGTTLYARSQNNNHAISEAVGLLTAARLLQEHPDRESWRRRGHGLLREAVTQQIDADGGYVQQSIFYHRLMLQLLNWCVRHGDVTGDPVAEAIRAPLRRAYDFLLAMTDGESGQAANSGANDGALLLPWTVADYGDQRGVLNATARLLGETPSFGPGAWDEESLWLLGSVDPPGGLAAAAATPIRLPHAGYYRIAADRAWAQLRAADYRVRPAQSDELHLDFARDGHAITLDPGTYLYNGAPPWTNPLARTSAHNTVTIDNRDAMTRVTPFLWTDWSHARVTSIDGNSITAEHSGYQKLGVRHRRGIRLTRSRALIVVDDLLGSGEHHVRLHWLLADATPRLELSPLRLSFDPDFGAFALTVAGAAATLRPGLVRGGLRLIGDPHPDDVVAGFHSPIYSRLEPGLSFVFAGDASLPTRLVSVIAEADAAISIDLSAGTVTLSRESSSEVVQLAPPGSDNLFPDPATP